MIRGMGMVMMIMSIDDCDDAVYARLAYLPRVVYSQCLVVCFDFGAHFEFGGG